MSVVAVADVEEEVRQFIVDNFLFGEDAASLDGRTSFLEQGIIDSTGVLELVSFVETTYGVTVADEELIPDHLDSIDSLTAFIIRKLNA